MMMTMVKFTQEHQIAVRGTPESRVAFDSLVSRLKAAGRLKVGPRRISNESFANAVYLALADIPLARIEKWLQPYMDKLATTDDGEDDDSDVGPAIPELDPPAPLEPTQKPPRKITLGSERDETAMDDRIEREHNRRNRKPPKGRK